MCVCVCVEHKERAAHRCVFMGVGCVCVNLSTRSVQPSGVYLWTYVVFVRACEPQLYDTALTCCTLIFPSVMVSFIMQCVWNDSNWYASARSRSHFSMCRWVAALPSLVIHDPAFLTLWVAGLNPPGIVSTIHMVRPDSLGLRV